ncbi:MAG TPA: PrsW family intramembrane metalloprotease [Acidobacteriaceae bacterium]|nr:PrsW family intramembrane metalloprotease [Acidobacteriaceae bacterium]
MAKRPGGAMLLSDTPTHSQWVPVLTKWRDIGKKSELAPILVTIVTVLLLFFLQDGSVISTSYEYAIGRDIYGGTIYTSWYLIVVCAYLMLLSLYFIRRVAGKDKSWTVLLIVGCFTGYLLYLFKTEHDFAWMYDFFHGSLAGGEVQDTDSTTQTFVKHFLGTGFFEETFKALPLFVLALASAYMPAGLRSLYGIEEPLDGILLGAASGGGFAFMETISQYVSRNLVWQWRYTAAVFLHRIPPDDRVVAAWIAKLTPKSVAILTGEGSAILGWQPGLPLLIPRSLGEAFGHMAYAGCFGYFIGLAIMKPKQRWKTLAIGLVSASLLHALWDTLSDSNVLLAIVAILSYAVLAAGILKAREISPNRATLLPSIFVGSLSPTPSAVAAYAAAPPAPAPQPVSPPKPAYAPNPLPNGTANLRVGAKYLVIVPGLRLMSHQVPGLQAQSAEGLVAEVTRNPNDPDVLGLTNLSTASWEVVTSSNTRRAIQPGQTVKLSPGTRIDFGETDGEVR